MPPREGWARNLGPPLLQLENTSTNTHEHQRTRRSPPVPQPGGFPHHKATEQVTHHTTPTPQNPPHSSGNPHHDSTDTHTPCTAACTSYAPTLQRAALEWADGRHHTMGMHQLLRRKRPLKPRLLQLRTRPMKLLRRPRGTTLGGRSPAITRDDLIDNNIKILELNRMLENRIGDLEKALRAAGIPIPHGASEQDRQDRIAQSKRILGIT